MSLQFIFGNSGSGKSSYLYHHVLEESGKHPDKNYLIIVPEQFTMQTQRELVELQEKHAIMNVDVLSFARLAYRVFDDLGKSDFVILEETGKNLVLRKVAEDKKSELMVLSGNMNKMGYISEVKSFISELSQYHIGPQQLEQFLQTEEIGESLRLKMQDIFVMYQGFADYLEGKFITAEEVLLLLWELTDQSELIRDSVIVFDEFTGFTPIQNLLIERFMVYADEILVSLSMDSREDFYHCKGMQELFAMSKKTVEKLQKIAFDVHCEIKDPLVLHQGEEHRFKDAPALYFMEQNIFRPKKNQWEEETTEISITGLKCPVDELTYVGMQITKLVREQGFRYQDIAVVTGDVLSYSSYVPDIFDQFEIPYFLDETKNIRFQPFIEFIRGVLEVVEYDFSYESVFRVLRCGLMEEIAVSEIDELENYVLAKGIRGAKNWKKEWTFVERDGTARDMTRLNEVRQKVSQVFEPLAAIFHEKTAKVAAQTMALYELIEGLHIEQQLKERETCFQVSDPVKAKEYGQIYRIVMELLDKIVSLLGEEQMSVREYGDILDAGFEAAQVAVIPPGKDKVTIGDIERTRLNHIKVLFFIGVNDGIIPKPDHGGGIISQYEREQMEKCHMELAPGAREKAFIQKFYLYLNMTKPSHRLYLTFSRVNSAGKTLRRSYLIGTLQKLFPKLVITELEQFPLEDEILTPKSSLSFFLRGLEGQDAFERGKYSTESDMDLSEMWKALAKWYEADEEYRPQILRMIGAAFEGHTDEPIGRAVTKALYGNELENSVTRLEQFASCAFAHFLNYGLELRERELQEFASVDMGNIYHDTLELFAKQIEESEYTWFDLPEDMQDVYIEKSMEQAIMSSRSLDAFEDAKNKFLLMRMRNTIKRTVWALIKQVQKGKFVPNSFEVSFSKASHLDELHFVLGQEEQMQLRGRIDRVDTYEQEQQIYVKIIDYKSGNTSFSLLNLYHGLQLQLVVYLNAAMELVSRKNPGKEVQPGGIFYYHINDPMIEATGTESEEEIRQAVFEELKLEGLVNDASEVYEAMDQEMTDSSSVIPIGMKKDGSLKANSSVASTQEFFDFLAFTRKKIQKTGQRIFDGDVSVRPYQLGDKTGCDYCPYHSVCGFDTRIKGFAYEKLDTIRDREEIIQKMREEE